MNLQPLKAHVSLPQYLDENFIKPSRQTLKWWAARVGVTYCAFHTMMRGKQNSLSLPVILEFSNSLNISPEELIRIQNRFLLDVHWMANANAKPLEKIESKNRRQRRPLRSVLSDDFLRPMKISYRQLARQMKVPFYRLTNFLNCVKHGYHDHDFLCRLGDALGTGGKFWLDFQSKQNLDQFIVKHRHLQKYFDWNPPMTFSEMPTILSREQPGAVLEENFLIPSGIPLHHWADFFCTSPETFRRFLDSKNLMDFRFIALLVKAFGTKASYWIDLQNSYLETKYLQESRSLGIKPLVPKPRKNRTTKLGNVLICEHLTPLGITPTTFGRYITGNKFFGDHLISGHDRVGVDEAVKFGQALGTTPMYWLDLQMEEDLASPKKRRRRNEIIHT